MERAHFLSTSRVWASWQTSPDEAVKIYLVPASSPSFIAIKFSTHGFEPHSSLIFLPCKVKIQLYGRAFELEPRLVPPLDRTELMTWTSNHPPSAVGTRTRNHSVEIFVRRPRCPPCSSSCPPGSPHLPATTKSANRTPPTGRLMRTRRWLGS